MLFPIALTADATGTVRALAPDLPGCAVAGATEPTVLPLLRLAIEDELTRRLLAGEPLLDTRDGRPSAGPAPAGLRRWLTIHINLDHLRALATHQAGR